MMILGQLWKTLKFVNFNKFCLFNRGFFFPLAIGGLHVLSTHNCNWATHILLLISFSCFEAKI